MKYQVYLLLMTFSFFIPSVLQANAFNTLNYSGRIVNLDGSPKTGTVDLEVRFFDSQEAGLEKAL